MSTKNKIDKWTQVQISGRALIERALTLTLPIQTEISLKFKVVWKYLGFKPKKKINKWIYFYECKSWRAYFRNLEG